VFVVCFNKLIIVWVGIVYINIFWVFFQFYKMYVFFFFCFFCFFYLIDLFESVTGGELIYRLKGNGDDGC